MTSSERCYCYFSSGDDVNGVVVLLFSAVMTSTELLFCYFSHGDDVNETVVLLFFSGDDVISSCCCNCQTLVTSSRSMPSLFIKVLTSLYIYIWTTTTTTATF